MSVRLRDVTEEDLPIFFEHQNDPVANEMAAFPAREREAFLTHWRTKVLPGATNGKRTILTEDDEVAGNIVSWNHDGRRLIGYWIGRSYWGRGIATKALKELVTSYETTRPLHAFVAARNVGSIRVLEKCGFVRTSYDGQPSDGVEEYLYVLGS